ncbi:acid phosphatase/Vanadium-dependent haloperoxidase [Sodiomyces alkalinus F11]|uniref:Acid phosphatase/Vanadium-dependent haloperoxidase n=1 Tax=Sodiomyces alkalinus (strain CBS 110278 / VKM F-3762 / F11) TaxID=1314773 RepID=A0A3N2Q5N8_SODAK|nr:acid phosphatase/Vanadium-dependent haloperoxidase [Sodiomyces alkalinus F11]ROT42016.1 acid phosphatase/Vanadium-dependent haloperoxidase [Sodiomyces alkalinus F11]
MWPDLLIMVVLGGAAIRINAAPLLGTRTFPVTFDRSGDIVFPSLAYPNRGWIVSPLLTGILCSVIPMSVILLSQFRVRSFWDANNGIMGLGLALLMGIVSKLLIKHLVGGFRPSFLQVCMPDTSLAAARNASGLNGVGFQQAFYTADICTQPDKGALKVAMTSFPSGHTTVASAGFGFLYLYLNGKLKVISASRPRLWTAVLLVLPLLAAFLMGAILTVDRAHHWYDILAGAVIGTVTALIAYRSCYAATWDWRYNHIPLARGETFLYKPGNAAQSRHGVLANRDWGKPRPREEEQLGIEMEEMV